MGSSSLCEVDINRPGQLTVTVVDAILNRIFNARLFAINTRISSSEIVEMCKYIVCPGWRNYSLTSQTQYIHLLYTHIRNY